jgi:monomeric type NADP-dependent isocitrate dehydrogenase
MDRARCEDGTHHQVGQHHRLKPKVSLLDREVIDSMFMSKKALCEFYEKEIEDARKTGVMFSLHVKATMMKVSHPIVFGHCVKIFYKDAFEKHGKLFDELGVNVNNGMANLYNKIAKLPQSKQRRDQARLARLPRAPARAGHGRFRQGHHQFPFAQRHHR